MHIATFTDFVQGDKDKIQRLKKNALLKENHVFTAADLTGQPEADLEDVLGRNFYVELVNSCYKLKGKNALPNTKPTAAQSRAVKEVEDHFRTLPNTIPEFDHYTPCAYLLSNAESLRGNLPEENEALDRFEELFKSLNALL